jgi:hypothetical protein
MNSKSSDFEMPLLTNKPNPSSSKMKRFNTPTSLPTDVAFLNPWTNHEFTMNSSKESIETDAKALVTHIVLQQVLAGYYRQYDVIQLEQVLQTVRLLVNATRFVSGDASGIFSILSGFAGVVQSINKERELTSLAKLHLQVSTYLIERRLMIWDARNVIRKGKKITNTQTTMSAISGVLNFAYFATGGASGFAQDLLMTSTFSATDIILNPDDYLSQVQANAHNAVQGHAIVFLKHMASSLSTVCNQMGATKPKIRDQLQEIIKRDRHPMNCSHCQMQVFGRPYLCSTCAHGSVSCMTPVLCQQCHHQNRNPCGNHRYIPLVKNGDEQYDKGFDVMVCDSCEMECFSAWMSCNRCKDAAVCIWCFELKYSFQRKSLHPHRLYLTFAEFK